MEQIYIIGVGMTPFGRHLDKSVRELTAWAVEEALEDASCDRKMFDMAYFGNTTQGWQTGGQIALLPLGIEGVPIYNVDNACATGSTAVHLAIHALHAGAADIALAVGVEKMYSTDKDKMLSLFRHGWDEETLAEHRPAMEAMGRGVPLPPGTTSDQPYSPLMDIYASIARQYIRLYGITQRQLAVISSKNHMHSVHNLRSQYRKAMTVEDILAAKPITYPLTVPMCAPISDGAAAAIVCTEAALHKYCFDRKRAIRILASVMRSATQRDVDDLQHAVSRLTAQQAYEKAGVGPEDIDVAEIHDASAMGELAHTSYLGFCAPGEGGVLAESGATTIGGRMPINPSGGLESKGHPLAATGLAQIFELVSQLRGECDQRQIRGARIALQENSGGLWGIEDASVHIGIYARA